MAEKASKPLIVTIDGEGTIPLVADGAMRRVARGERIEITAAELAYLKASGVEFNRSK